MSSKKKKTKAKGVDVDLGETKLRCEWGECVAAFRAMPEFINHMTNHITEYYNNMSTPEVDVFECLWRECGSKVVGITTDFNRHVYFHAFHVKIKNVGAAVLEKRELSPCRLDTASRNLIPELPERLQCGWLSCEVVHDNPEYFYLHMDMHAKNFPDGNHVPGGCKCQWDGCEVVVKSKYRMREHLRSHTQEKMIACPTCGALFCNRTKFLDHLKRQGTAEVQCYECSHCNKRFTSERLLRDHMRHHVNQYKCPYCDMTCPTPSGLRNHLLYRHTEDRPYKCDQCDYSCKSNYDLRKHMDTHTILKTFQCHVPGCEFRVRTYVALSNHVSKDHQGLEAARYACHVCNRMFTRGYHLTLHLKRHHKFKWPSGHSRFRYKPHDDGFLRLQTVRYESVELMDQIEEASSSGVTAVQSEQNQENVAPPQSVSNSVEEPMECSETDRGSGSGVCKGGSLADPDMSYNLEMLGEVALHGTQSSATTTVTQRKLLPKPCHGDTGHTGAQIGHSQHQFAGHNDEQNEHNYSVLMEASSTNHVFYQGSSSSVFTPVCQTLPDFVNTVDQDNNVQIVGPQMTTLNNMDQSSLQSFSDSGNGSAEPTSYIPLQAADGGDLAQTYVLCSRGMEFMDQESTKHCTDGAEMDILKLQQSASDTIRVVGNN